MKLVIPPVESELVGEEEQVEERGIDLTATRLVVTSEYPVSDHREDRNQTQIANRTKDLFIKGLFTRAIVTGGYTSVLNSQDAQADPKNWGIVVAVDTYNPYPLAVQWLDGQVRHHKEEELILIWPGCGKNEIIALIQSRGKPKQ